MCTLWIIFRLVPCLPVNDVCKSELGKSPLETFETNKAADTEGHMLSRSTIRRGSLPQLLSGIVVNTSLMSMDIIS